MSVSKPRSSPLRVLFGDEDYLLDQAIEKARQQKRRETVVLDGENLSGQGVVTHCGAYTLSEQDRGIILDNAQKVKDAAPLQTFIEEWDLTDRSVVLVAVVRASKVTPAWLKAAMERGATVQFVKPKPWETDKQIKRIEEQAKLTGVRLKDGVPQLLIKVVGYDLRLIANELRKLADLVGDKEATTKDVGLLIPHVFPVEPYEVANAAADRNPKRALTLFGFLVRNQGEGAVVPVTYSLLRLVEKLIIARQMLDKKDDLSVVAGRLEMHPYAFQKNLLPLAKKHSVKRLRGQMQNLCRLDSQVKGAARSKRTLVELALLSFAT